MEMWVALATLNGGVDMYVLAMDFPHNGDNEIGFFKEFDFSYIWPLRFSGIIEAKKFNTKLEAQNMVKNLKEEEKGYGWYVMKVSVDDYIKQIERIEPLHTYDGDELDPAWSIIQMIMDSVPNIYKEDFEYDDTEIATNGIEFLFKYEADCERFADALDRHVFNCRECHTGYYDPIEDEANGETDANTGWYYVDFD